MHSCNVKRYNLLVREDGPVVNLIRYANRAALPVNTAVSLAFAACAPGIAATPDQPGSGLNKPPASRSIEITQGSASRLAKLDMSLANKLAAPVTFNTHSGLFTLNIPETWRANTPTSQVYGRTYNGYQTFTAFVFIPPGTMTNLEALKKYEEDDLNSDIIKYGKAAGKSTSKAQVSKEKVAGQYDAYLISGVIPNGSMMYKSSASDYSGTFSDVELNTLVFVAEGQAYRFNFYTHPEATKKELPNFAATMNSFCQGKCVK